MIGKCQVDMIKPGWHANKSQLNMVKSCHQQELKYNFKSVI